MKHFFDFSQYVRWGDNETPSKEGAYEQLIGLRGKFIETTLRSLFARMGCEGRATSEGLALLDEIYDGLPPRVEKATAAQLAKEAKTVVFWFCSLRFKAFCSFFADTVPVDLG